MISLKHHSWQLAPAPLLEFLPSSGVCTLKGKLAHGLFKQHRLVIEDIIDGNGLGSVGGGEVDSADGNGREQHSLGKFLEGSSSISWFG